MSDQELITLKEAAAIVGVEPITIRRWAAGGRLALYRFGPRSLRVDAQEVRALVEVVPTASVA